MNYIPGAVAYLAGSACLVQACHQNYAGSKHQRTHSIPLRMMGGTCSTQSHQRHWPSAISLLSRVLQAAGDAGEGLHQLNTVDGDVEMSLGRWPDHPSKPGRVRLPEDHCMEHQVRKLSLDVGDGLDAISVDVFAIRHEE